MGPTGKQTVSIRGRSIRWSDAFIANSTMGLIPKTKITEFCVSSVVNPPSLSHPKTLNFRNASEYSVINYSIQRSGIRRSEFWVNCVKCKHDETGMGFGKLKFSKKFPWEDHLFHH